MNNKTYDHVLNTPWASIGIFSLTTFLSVIHLINGGRVIVPSTDILWFWEPLLEIFHDNFRNGELGYWNPLIAGGTGNYFNTYYTPFSLEFLLAALFSKKFVYHILTLTYLAHLFLIGVVSHRILLREVPNVMWATAGAFVAQLSLPISVALTSPAAIYNVTYFLLALYIVWSFEKRHPVLSLLYLTLAIVLCGLTGNLAIGSWAGVVFVILVLYRVITMPISAGGVSRYQFGALTGFAIVAAFFITAIHWLPLAISLPESVRLGNVLDNSKIMNSGPSIARIFVPEWLGVHYSPSYNYFVDLGRDGQHIQAYAPVSYGIFTAIACIFGLAMKRTRRSLFWATLTIILVCIAGRIDPVFSLYALLFNPVIHPFGVEFFTPIVVGALVGHTGVSLFEVREGNYEWKSIGLLGFILVLMGYIIYSWTAILHHLELPIEVFVNASWARLFFIILSLSFVVVGYVILFKSENNVRALLVFMVGVGLATSGFVLGYLKFVKSSTPFYFESQVLIAFRILLYSALPMILLIASRYSNRENKKLALWFAIFVTACLTFFSYLFQRPNGMLHPGVSSQGDLVVAVLSLFSLGAAILSFLLSMKIIATAQIQRALGSIFFVLVIAADLIATFHINDRMIIYPAHSLEQLDARPGFDIRTASFRDQDGKPVDAVNFRIGQPISFVGTIKGGIWSGASDHLETNAPATLGMSTYSGIPHVVDKKIRDLYGAFGLVPSIGGISAHLKDPLFLDLLSVGYIFDNGRFIRRQSRIGRFQLYSAWRLVKNPEAALKILKSPDFDPLWKLVIVEDRPPLKNMRQEKSKLIPIIKATSDHIKLEVDSPHPAILLFNDNYSRWWQATVNGNSVNIMKANFSRMALTVPEGRSKVELELKPAFLNQSAVSAAIGVLVLFVGATWLFRAVRSLKLKRLEHRLVNEESLN